MPRGIHRILEDMQIIGLPTHGGVSIEIGDRNIRFVEIAPHERGAQVMRFGELPLAAGIVESGMIVDSLRLEHALKDLRRTYGVTTARGLLPHGHVIHLRVRLPEGGMRTAGALARSLSVHTGGEAEDIVSHTSRTLQLPEATEIIAAVTSRAVSESHAKAYTAAGIQLYSLESKTEALIRALAAEIGARTALVIDVEHTMTAFFVADAESVGNVSVAAFGTDTLDQSIADRFGVSREEAAELRTTIGFVRTPESEALADALAPHARALCDAIRRVFLERHTGAGEDISKVDEIVLTGVGATIPGLAEYISASMRLPVRVGALADTAAVVPVIPRSVAPAYLSLIGLGQSPHQHGRLLTDAALRRFVVAKRIHSAVVTLLVGAIATLLGFIVWLGTQ